MFIKYLPTSLLCHSLKGRPQDLETHPCRDIGSVFFSLGVALRAVAKVRVSLQGMKIHKVLVV